MALATPAASGGEGGTAKRSFERPPSVDSLEWTQAEERQETRALLNYVYRLPPFLCEQI